jgi:hypothetical protein
VTPVSVRLRAGQYVAAVLVVATVLNPLYSRRG